MNTENEKNLDSKTGKLVWFANDSKEIGIYNVARCFWQSAEDAVQVAKAWRADKIIGEPKATDACSVEELKAMGVIGLYRREPHGDRNQ